MKYCSKCGGTGTQINGKFCTCTEGRFKRAEHEAKLKGELKKADEARQKMQQLDHPNARCSVQKKKLLKLSYFEVDDWVEVRRGYYGAGSIGFITKIDADDKTANVVFVTYGKSRRPCFKTGWIDEAAIKHYNPPAEDDDLKALIDLALKNDDKNWFDELTDKLKGAKK